MNVLIVDDDVYVVEALRRSVPWGSIGIGKVYYAYSVERAKKLLKSGSVKVGEVSEKVGYKDVNYFSLTFKKYTGYSPAEYREKNISR